MNYITVSVDEPRFYCLHRKLSQALLNDQNFHSIYCASTTISLQRQLFLTFCTGNPGLIPGSDTDGMCGHIIQWCGEDKRNDSKAGYLSPVLIKHKTTAVS